MNTKNDVEVIINGKQYTLSGYESSEYLQKIANHINDKLAEFRQSDGYARLDGDMKNILLAINLSDDYYKVQQRVDDLQREKEELEQEIFNIKHDMIEMKTLLQKRGEEIEALQRDKTESEHMVIRLETELEGAKAENSVAREQAAESAAAVQSASAEEAAEGDSQAGESDGGADEDSPDSGQMDEEDMDDGDADVDDDADISGEEDDDGSAPVVPVGGSGNSSSRKKRRRRGGRKR